jgi:tetratricopeptide (TPR) repeat protein
MRPLHLIVAAFLIVSVAGPAMAQAGRASGSVLDSDGKPISGATIQAANSEAYPPLITSTTDKKGRFAMIGLRSGVWRFTAAAPGFLPRDGSIPIRSGTPGGPIRFVLVRSPEPIPGALPRDIDRQLDAAESLRGNGQYEQALAIYESIQEKSPKLTSLNLVIGNVYREQASKTTDTAARQELLSRARTAYGEVLKAEGEHDRATLELGLTEEAAGNTDAATRAFQAVISANPDSAIGAEAATHLQQLTTLSR